MKNFSKQALDQAVLSVYPEARKAPTPDEFDDLIPVAHYILIDFPDANELGFIDEDERWDYDFDENDYVATAVTFAQDPETKRVFFWERDRYGFSLDSYSLSTGEYADGKLICQLGRETN